MDKYTNSFWNKLKQKKVMVSVIDTNRGFVGEIKEYVEEINVLVIQQKHPETLVYIPFSKIQYIYEMIG